MGIFCYFGMVSRLFMKVYMPLSVIMLLITVFFFSRALLTYMGIESLSSIFFLTLVVVVPWIGFNKYLEIFAWVCGNANYNIGICLGLAFLTTLLTGNKNNCIMVFISCIFGFLTAGLNTGICCWIGLLALLIVLAGFYKNKSNFLSVLIPFVVFCIGGIINLLSPGNYVRHQQINDASGNSGISFIKCIPEVVEHVVKIGIPKTLNNPFMILSMVGLFILGIVISRKNQDVVISKWKIIQDMLLIFMIPSACLFPFGVGANSVEHLPNRMFFIYDFTLILTISIFVVDFAIFIGHRLTFSMSAQNKRILCAVTTCLFLIFAFSRNFFADSSFRVYATYLENGETARYSKEIYSLIDDIENSEESDVVIGAIPSPPPTLLDFQIISDTVRYFDKNSIVSE